MAESAPQEGTTDPLSNERPVYDVDIPLTALLGFAVLVVVTVFILTTIDRAQQLLMLAIFAALLSSLLAPLVATVARAIGRVAATVVLHLVVLVALAGCTAFVIGQIRTEASSLETYTAEQIDELEASGGTTFLGRTRIDERLSDAAESWGTGAVTGESDVAGIATRLSELAITVVLSAFLTLQGSRLVDIAMTWSSHRERRRLLREVWRDVVTQATAYLRRAAAAGVVVGLATSAVAVGFGLPGVVLLGVWAALLSVVPLLGGIVGWLPLVVVAAVDRSPQTTALVAAVALAGIVATSLLRSRVVRVEVDPGSFLVAVGIAAGLSAAGLPGAAIGMFVAVAVVTVARHDWSEIRAAGVDDESDDRAPVGGIRLSPRPASRGANEGSSPSLTGDDRLLLQLTRGTALRVTALIVFAFALQLSIARVGPILVWAVVGILIAIGLDQPVSWIARRVGIPRSAVVITGAIVVAIGVVALVGSAGGSIGTGDRLDDEIPSLVSSLEDLPLIGDRLAELELAERIDDFIDDAPDVVTRSPITGRAVGIVGGGIVGAFWVVVVALTGLLDGPRLIAAVDRRVPARFRRQCERLGRAGTAALAGYVAGSALVAAMNGVLIGTLALVFGVPLGVFLAFWAFGWNFIPQVGALIGWAPLLVLSLLQGTAIGLTVLVVFVLYQALENNVIQPTIVGHAVDISALAALGAALLGGAVAGLIGAVLAIPVAGVARALVMEWNRDDFPRRGIAPGDEPVHGAPLP
ncbi:AI-2E family transporter [Ilumatobacter sp.]|uniref:AI-2E family transporter n=1 Tax=Ilumatobacter sp. TaxID=1967498 RepID=UPI003B51CB2C